MEVLRLRSFLNVIKMFVHNVSMMMELVASPRKKLVLPIYAEGIIIAQAATSTPAPRTKFHKFDPNMEMLFQIGALEDKGGWD